MSPRSGRILLAIVLAGLWIAGSLWRSASLNLQTVVVTVIVVVVVVIVIVDFKFYWLNFSS